MPAPSGGAALEATLAGITDAWGIAPGGDGTASPGAAGVTLAAGPVQRPRVPLLIGGGASGDVAVRRPLRRHGELRADRADGWRHRPRGRAAQVRGPADPLRGPRTPLRVGPAQLLHRVRPRRRAGGADGEAPRLLPGRHPGRAAGDVRRLRSTSSAPSSRRACSTLSRSSAAAIWRPSGSSPSGSFPLSVRTPRRRGGSRHGHSRPPETGPGGVRPPQPPARRPGQPRARRAPLPDHRAVVI